MAAPSPIAPPAIARWYARVTKRWVALAGPPRVMVQTSWKSVKVKMAEKMVRMVVSGSSSTQVICQKICPALAPSIWAASCSSFGIACSPARYPTVKKGIPRQTFATISEPRASQGVPRKSRL